MSEPTPPADPTAGGNLLPAGGTLPETALPDDPDVEGDVDTAARARVSHLSAANIGWVMAGGTAGTGARYLIGTHTPIWAGVPVATVAINVVGAFILGGLLSTLARHSPASAWAHRARLGGGTGVLGGFTTYSALATDTVLLATAHPGRATAYALITVIAGGVASVLGIWVGRRPRRDVGVRR